MTNEKKPKNLQEFIEEVFSPYGFNEKEHVAMEAICLKVVAHLLEVAKEKSYDIHEDYYSDSDTPLMVVDLKDFTTYCAPMEDLKEHAKKRHDDHKEAFEKLAKE